MYCKHCGTPSETEVCPNCAAAQEQPQTQMQPQSPAAPADPIQTVKANLHYILAGIAVLAFLWGILNVFSVFHVNASVSWGGFNESEYVSVSDAADSMDAADSSAISIYLGNIIFGLANLAAAAIGALYFLKIFKNMPYYDQYIESKLKLRPAFAMGAIGAVGAILQFILYLFCGASAMGVDLSFGVNWTTWLLFIVFAGIAVFDKFVLEKKAQ